MNHRTNIAARFDDAAGTYDAAASLQMQVAAQLVRNAKKKLSKAPDSILDIGSGTGLVAMQAAHAWPRSLITAIDGAPGMLHQAQNKIPHMHVIEGDIAEKRFPPSFDLILSSMTLHWLLQPRALLDVWQKGLKPDGRLFAALLVEGSFQEWRDLCADENVPDGLWPMPPVDFANDLTTERQTIRVHYPSAYDFLRRLKSTGAAAAHPNHRPIGIIDMRRLLARGPKPFPVSYRVLYIEMQSADSI